MKEKKNREFMSNLFFL